MQTLSQLHTIFQTYLEENKFNFSPKELYEPIDYILSLGGKRLRPLLVLMSYDLFKDDVEAALPAAFSVEIFHNFSLLHDDIMDEAPLRRGQATVHTKYDINTGILSGDVMLIYTYKYLMQLATNSNLAEIINVFNQVAVDVCEGQQFDMNFEKRDNVAIDEYINMISLKTASLVAGAMKMGALIAGASAEDAEHAYEFGRNVGIAFQLQDDILDTFGDPQKFGKKVGGDIVQNKKTYLVLKSLEVADAEVSEKLSQQMVTKTTDEVSKIETVRGIFESLNVRELAEGVKQGYQKTAFEHLNSIQVTDERKQTLKQLATELLEREV